MSHKPKSPTREAFARPFHMRPSAWLSGIVIGVVLNGVCAWTPAHAQGLEENIDAELDEAVGATSASAPPPQPSPTPGPAAASSSAPQAAPQPQNAMEDDLMLDEGEEENATLDSGSEVGALDGGEDLQLDSEPVEPAQKAAEAPAPPLESEPPPAIEEPPPAVAEPGQFAGSDEPNIDFERRLHRIFQNSKPVSDERWSEMIGARREEVYQVQAGDTLWDISQTFFGDGFFWSKLWAENGSIENPHKISPGRGIRFIAGTEAEAPSVNVTETAVIASNTDLVSMNSLVEPAGDAPVYRDQFRPLTDSELAAGGEVEDGELIPAPDLPPGRPSKPVLKKLPPSFVMPRSSFEGNYDSTGLDAPKPRAQTTSASIVVNSYLEESTPKGIGRLEEVEMGDKVASLGQNVFIKMDQSVSNGQKLYVVYPKDKISDAVRGNIGPVIEVGGTLEVIEPVDSSKGVYKAAVTYAVNPIRVDSVILNEPLPRADFSRRGTRSDVQARVVGGEFDETRRLFGEGAVIYLDSGTSAGLHDGDLLAVQGERGVRREDTQFPEAKHPIGLIKVVKALPSVATAIVLEADEEIRPGDKTGGSFPRPKRNLKVQNPSTDRAQVSPVDSAGEEGDLDF